MTQISSILPTIRDVQRSIGSVYLLDVYKMYLFLPDTHLPSILDKLQRALLFYSGGLFLAHVTNSQPAAPRTNFVGICRDIARYV